MASVLQYDFLLGSKDVIEVWLSDQANVLLMDTTNLDRFKRGEYFESHGGHQDVWPAYIPAPWPGHWHLVINPQQLATTVKAAVRVIKG